MKIGITGHRPDDFIKSHYNIDSLIRKISDIIYTFKRKFDPDLIFNIGGAVGADQWVGMACLECGVKYKLFLPFLPQVQAKYWSEEQRKEFDRQLKGASGIDIMDLSGKYLPEFYEVRNQKLIDSSDFLLAFWVGKKRGGTFNAIKYALNKSKLVYNGLNNNSLIDVNDLSNGWTPLLGEKDE